MARWVRVGAGAVAGAVVGALAVYLTSDGFLYGGREHIDLESWIEAEDAWTQAMAPGAQWATEDLCDADRPCTQAVTSETLTLYRFADRGDAVAAARDFAGEGYLSGWIVIRFEPGMLSQAERWEVAHSLDCTNVAVSEDGLEC